MKPIEDLKREHQAIKLMLTILTEVARELETGQAADLKDLNDILEFLKVFADRCHHAKEEQLLFPALEKAGLPREQGPLEVMLNEHNEGRIQVKVMEEALDGIARGQERAGLNFARQARAYVDLLAGHIDKEDNVLYPLADDRLGRKARETLEAGFERLEREIIGPGRHQEFQRLLERLEKKYLEPDISG